MFGHVLRHHIEPRRDDQLVAIERRVGIYNVDALRERAQGVVVAGHQCDGIEIGVVQLEIHGPAAVVGMQQGDLGDGRGAGELCADGGEIAAELSNFVVERDGRAVGADERAVILLLSIERAAPLPIADFIGAVADVLPGHGADFAAIQKIIVARPVHGAGLRFDHPEIALLESAREIVRETFAIDAHVAGANVVVPRRDGEGLAHDVVIEAVEKSHEIRGDELARIGMRADRIDLGALENIPFGGAEAIPIEAQAGIVIADGDGNFRPLVVGLAPVGGGPVSVEVGERLVFRLQPIVEFLAGDAVVGEIVEAAVFVIDLPANDVGIVAVTQRHLLGDFAREANVKRRSNRALLARAVRHLLPIFERAQRFGIFCGEPGGRRGRGRPEYDPDMMPRGGGDGVIEPNEIVVAFGGLHRAPRKFRDAHDVDVRGFHEFEVGVPARFGPLLGIPIGAEEQRHLLDGGDGGRVRVGGGRGGCMLGAGCARGEERETQHAGE